MTAVGELVFGCEGSRRMYEDAIERGQPEPFLLPCIKPGAVCGMLYAHGGTKVSKVDGGDRA